MKAVIEAKSKQFQPHDNQSDTCAYPTFCITATTRPKYLPTDTQTSPVVCQFG